MAESIAIAGGGLAGLTLGIGLCQRGVPVTVWEAGRYPRHRVCGEFISGGGKVSLARLGLLEGLHIAGAIDGGTVAFFSDKATVAAYALPDSAVCVSRFILDELLAREFQRLGGELRLGARWGGEFGPGIVRATGRRAEPMAGGWRLFGLKVHARGIALDADLEMHFVPAGYVGLCQLAGGEVNICGLFRSRTTVPDLAQRWRDYLGGPVGSALRSRLAGAQFDDGSFCSVAGLCLRPQRALYQNECRIGDALTMMPPVTGNGMSMAFESAELAIEPLEKFSHGELNWDEARQEIALRCDRAFAPRLRWAARLQAAMLQPRARPILMFLAARSERLRRALFERTR